MNIGSWELGVVGSWELGIGSCQKCSIKNSIHKPLLRIARTEQAIRRTTGERHVPLVAIPPFLPPVARRAPRAGTHPHSPAIHAAPIDRHARGFAVRDTHTRRDRVTEASECDGECRS